MPFPMAIRNFLTLLSGNTIAQAIPFLIYPVLTRLYSPSDFGILALYLSFFSLLSIFTNGRYDYAIILPHNRTDAIYLLWLTVCINVVTSLFFLALFVFFPLPIAVLSGQPALSGFLWMLPLSLFFTGIQSALSQFAARDRMFRPISISEVARSAVTGTVKMLAVFTVCRDAGLIAGTVAGHIAAALVLFFPFRHVFKEIKINELKSGIRNMAIRYRTFPTFYLVNALTNVISGTLPVFAITRWFSVRDAGLFSLGMGMVYTPVALFTGSLSRIITKEITDLYNDRKPLHPSVRRITKLLIVTGSLPFVAVVLSAPNLCYLLFGEEWTEAGIYLQYLSPWLFLLYLAAPLNFLPNLFNRQKKAMFIDIIYLVMRVISFAAGIVTGKIFLALLLYALSGVTVLGYSLFWYNKLCYTHDKTIKSTAAVQSSPGYCK